MLKMKQKHEAPPGEKPELVRTHLRNMITVLEMKDNIIGVYNGKTFNQVEIKPEMISHYSVEFSISYKHVKHGRPVSCLLLIFNEASFSAFDTSSMKHVSAWGDLDSRFWELTYEDCLNLIAQVPVVAASIYRRMYKNGQIIPSEDSLDYGANFAHMLGFDSSLMLELMRLYVTIHSDHEGGNVNGHLV
ncbi:hypothetical protein SOVF_207980 [Spinacia oleracea]|nr:hypothetical protein SOVF_207980 [Spinacia oleracea]